MGDPKKLKKHYSFPGILWDKARIKEEKTLLREYGLKNMKELWRSSEELRKVRREARTFQSLGEEGTVESKNMINRLRNLGIVGAEAAVDDLFNLTVRDFLERRLQTQVFKKGMARTPKQARQLITHGFISINGRKVTKPSYAVKVEEEGSIAYAKTIDIHAGVQKEEKARMEKHETIKTEKETTKKETTKEKTKEAETEKQIKKGPEKEMTKE